MATMSSQESKPNQTALDLVPKLLNHLAQIKKIQGENQMDASGFFQPIPMSTKRKRRGREFLKNFARTDPTSSRTRPARRASISALTATSLTP